MAAAPAPDPGIMQPAADPLAALRDIHQPAMIDSFPPAPGWWLLAGLMVFGGIALCVWLFRKWRANRYRREALAELTRLLDDWRRHRDDHAYLEALQRLLKRVALTGFPREKVAGLTGEAWVQFLDQSTGSHDFSMGATEALIDGNYKPDVTLDVPVLQAVAKQWIRKHRVHYQAAQGRAS